MNQKLVIDLNHFLSVLKEKEEAKKSEQKKS